jgi:hypothetical protein
MERRRYKNGSGGTDVFVDKLVDIAGNSISQMVRDLVCMVGIDTRSFCRAARTLRRLGGLQVSRETVRTLVESEGNAVIQWHEQPQLPLDFDARTCLTDETEDHKPVSRVYVGVDGFMVPLVTDSEKQKRYKGYQARRKKLKRIKGQHRARLVRRKGADQRYKEFKLATMYDQPMKHKYIRVTSGGVAAVGRILCNMAEDIHLCGATQVIAVADGAAWIKRVLQKNLPKLSTSILDFYHCAQHVKAAAEVLYGKGTAACKKWEKQTLHGMRHEASDQWHRRLETKRSQVKQRSKRRAMEALEGYVGPRKQQMEYADFKRRGLHIGSGPTESACKSETLRLKGCGMRWNAANAAAMMALEASEQNGTWEAYWNHRAGGETRKLQYA